MRREQKEQIKIGVFVKTTDRTITYRMFWDVVNLCEATKSEGSLMAAVKKLGSSYSHACDAIKRTEGLLGYRLLNRDNYRSTLTPQAERLVGVYRSACEKAEKELEAVLFDLGASDSMLF